MSTSILPPAARLTSDQIPQADRPERVIELLEIVHRGVPLTPDETGLDARHIQYYSRAARVLGLLSTDDRLLAAGHVLLKGEADGRLARLALAFEGSACGQAWARWADCRFHEIDPRSAQAFLEAETNVAPSTAKRRATTLRCWYVMLSEHHPARRDVPVPLDTRGPRADIPHSVFDRRESGRVLEALAPGTHVLRVATAYFTVPGYEIVARRLTGSVIDLLVGSEDAVESVTEIIRAFTESISRGSPTWQKREALRLLHTELVQGSARVRVFDPRLEPRLHGKLYIFDADIVYTTSANMTGNGLRSNIETGQVVDDPKAVAFYIQKFEEHFKNARNLLPELLPTIEESWAFSELVAPYLLYLRVLLELYFEVPDLGDRTDYQLAVFQRMIVGSVLHVLREQGGALLIAPTGTGKTVMASYVAASLFPQTVHRVYVLCPNPSLADAWRMVLRAFGVTPDVITHGILQQKGQTTPESIERLENILASTRATDLVIVDECHVFKNPDSQGYENLNRLLQGLHRGAARRLFLTATPMSTGIEDLNTLLTMLSGEELDDVSDVATASSIVNITLPFIVSNFGHPDAGGGNRSLLFGRDMRSFPRIQFQTRRYPSPMERVFAEIGDLDLQFLRPARRRNQLGLPGLEEEGADTPVASGLLRLILMRRAESSPDALLRTIDFMITREYSETYRPADPDELTEQLTRLRELVCVPEDDTKLAGLLDVIRSRRDGERMLIFSSYTATVGYLARELTLRLPELRIGAITGQTTQSERRRLLARFAPRAQGKTSRARRDDLDVLIASDAIAEGENLQDATLLVNYDLHWTPLRLIQRVGRIDRPTKQFREADVVNFYPEGQLFEQMVQLWQRLSERSEMYQTLARTNVIGDLDRDLDGLDERDLGLVRALYEEQDYERMLREYLPTSNHLVERARAGEDQIERARSLPLGFRSARVGTRAGTFALLRVHGQHHCVFVDDEGVLSMSPEPCAHEALLAHVMADPTTPIATANESDIDAAVSALVTAWCAARREDPENVVVVCAEAVIAAH